MKRVLLALILALPAPFAWAQSQVPTLISYSGKVVDASGNGITATRTVTFRIWDNATATAAVNRLFSEQQSVTISGGEFSVLIGAGSAVSGEANAAGITTVADAFAGSNRFLGVTVDDGTAAADPEMSPRQQIVTTAFAFRAKVAESVAGGSVTSAMIANTAVNTTQLADAAVSTTKIADNAVQGTKILDGTITTAKIADGAITSAKLAFPIDASKLAANSVGSAQIAGNSIDSVRIVDGSVSLADLAPNSVDGGKIVDGSVGLNDIGQNAVDSWRIVDGSVGLVDIGQNAVDSWRIVDGSVALVDLAANSVNASKIVAGSVGRTQLDASVIASLPKPAANYTQGINDQGSYQSAGPKGWKIVPMDIGDLGNDLDGARIKVNAMHRVSFDGRMAEIQLMLEQPGMSQANTDFPNKIYGRTSAKNDYTVSNWHWKLNLTSVDDGWHLIAQSNDDWWRFYTFYPGSVRPGEAAPYNANQNHNASNASANGPVQSMTLAAVTSSGNVVTVTTSTSHVMQVGNTVTIAGVTGVVDGTRTVTARTNKTFTFNSTGPDQSYAVSGSSTVTYQPTFSKFMIFFCVHPHVSASVTIYDN
jgi:hypothetical protein